MSRWQVGDVIKDSGGQKILILAVVDDGSSYGFKYVEGESRDSYSSYPFRDPTLGGYELVSRRISAMDGVNVMLDLETLGTYPGCGVIQIGAVLFTEEGPSSVGSNTFHVHVRYDHKSGLHVDGATLAFWFSQGVDPMQYDKAYEARNALHALNQWLSEICPGLNPLRIWCHATFDLPVLEAFYRAHDVGFPWHHRAGRDVRLALSLGGVEVRHLEGERKHHALDDARAQARAIAQAYKNMRDGSK